MWCEEVSTIIIAITIIITIITIFINPLLFRRERHGHTMLSASFPDYVANCVDPVSLPYFVRNTTFHQSRGYHLLFNAVSLFLPQSFLVLLDFKLKCEFFFIAYSCPLFITWSDHFGLASHGFSLVIFPSHLISSFRTRSDRVSPSASTSYHYHQ